MSPSIRSGVLVLLAVGCGKSSPGDDGGVPPGGGATLWVDDFPNHTDPSHQGSTAKVGVDNGGNVVVAGAFLGTTSFGGASFSTTTGRDGFVAKLDPSGKHVFSNHLVGVATDGGTPGEIGIDWVAADGAGDVLVAGQYIGGAIDVGTGPLPAPAFGVVAGFAAKYDAAGNAIWAKTFCNQSALVHRVLPDASAGIAIFGELTKFTSPCDLGGGPITNNGTGGSFIVRVQQDGTYISSAAFPNAPASATSKVEVSPLCIDAAGNVVMTGSVVGNATFAGLTLSAATSSDLLVVKLDPSGAPLFHSQFATSAVPACADVAGRTALLVSFTSAVDFGAGSFTPGKLGSSAVVELDAAGKYVYATLIGHPATDTGVPRPDALAADTNGNVLVAGTWNGVIDFGSGPVTASNTNLFLLKLDASGRYGWSQVHGVDPGLQVGGLAVDPSGNSLVSGAFDTPFDFGIGTITTPSEDDDIFVMKAAP